MAAPIPPQRHRCPRHDWCLERVPGHRVHSGESHVLTTSRGTEIRVSLTAEGDLEPVVQFEASFDHDGPMMELAELDATEAVELAGFLLRLSRTAQASDEGVR